IAILPRASCKSEDTHRRAAAIDELAGNAENRRAGHRTESRDHRILFFVAQDEVSHVIFSEPHLEPRSIVSPPHVVGLPVTKRDPHGDIAHGESVAGARRAPITRFIESFNHSTSRRPTGSPSPKNATRSASVAATTSRTARSDSSFAPTLIKRRSTSRRA